MYQNTVSLLTLHPALHGLLLPTASYYLPKSRRLLSNCKRKRNKEWNSRLITNLRLKQESGCRLTRFTDCCSIMEIFSYLFSSVSCPLACWARAFLKMLRLQSQSCGIYELSPSLQKPETTAKAEGSRRESRPAQLHEATWVFFLFLTIPPSFLAPLIHAQNKIKN